MQRYSLTIFCLLLLLLPGLLLQQSREHPYQVAVFNTVGEIRLWSKNAQACNASAREIIAAWQELHRTLNLFAPESELSQLNRSPVGEAFACSERLWAVLQVAREVYALTDGAFDVSISPLMHLWGFRKQRSELPTDEEIAAILPSVGLEKIHFNAANRTVTFTRPGMALDFGGLAKGYALDLANEILDKNGLDCYLLDLGGNIYCTEKLPPGRKQPFQIGIRDPSDAGKIFKVLSIRNSFVSTSANYERGIRIGEKKIGHIIDPRSGQPVDNRSSVTVVTSRGSYSDAFSTAVFVAGPAMADKLSATVPRTSFELFP